MNLPPSLALIAALTVPMAAGALTVAVGTRPLIGWLTRRQFGKSIRADVPMHEGKSGTPTMGGLVLVGVVLGSIVVCAAAVWLWARWTFLGSTIYSIDGDPFGLETMMRIAARALATAMAATAFAVVAFGAIGFIDDWRGLARKGRAAPVGIGLSARRMFALQIAAGVCVAAALASVPMPPPVVTDVPPTSSWPAAILAAVVVEPGAFIAASSWPTWLVFATLVIVATVNGVNLSDGLDGLAAGLAAIAFAGLGLSVIGLHLTHEALAGLQVVDLALGLVCMAIAGACLGFLVHNRYPARVFMGNVTSMALGGALATIALASGAWPLLPLIGIVYVAEVASDVIQVGYFKWSGGKRVFRMAPIHHHFELLGWHETVVTRRFWLVGAIGAAAAVGFVWWASAGVW